MSKVFIDKFTKQQAIEYADNEADLHGFERKSERWEKALKEYLSFAYSTMSVGRNPRSNPSSPMLLQMFPEVFSASGFAGRLAQKFRNRPADQTVTFDAIRFRIASAVGTLAKLFENGELKMNVHPEERRQGVIENEKISDFQFAKKAEGESSEEINAQRSATIYHRLVDDLVTTLVIESLTPFMELSLKDVNDIMARVKTDLGGKEKELEERKRFVKAVRDRIRPVIQNINFRKILLGS